MSQNKKIVAIVLLLIAAYFASIALGVYRLKSSALYPITEKALTAHLASIKSKEAAGPFHMKWFAPWQYSQRFKRGVTVSAVYGQQALLPDERRQDRRRMGY